MSSFSYGHQTMMFHVVEYLVYEELEVAHSVVCPESV